MSLDRPPGPAASVRRLALVTGAASGLGRAVAQALAEAGHAVIVTDLDGAAACATARALQADGLTLDVCDELAWVHAMARVLDLPGRLDLLVNSAAIGGLDADPEHGALADWHAVQRARLDGLFLGCKHGIRALRRSGGGLIVNLSGRVDGGRAAADPAHADVVRRYTRRVALHCARQGLAIRCHAVHASPTARLARVAGVVALLARPQARMVQGADIRVDDDGIDGNDRAGNDGD